MPKMILTFVKNCQGQISIDQNRSEILEKSMRCSFLVKFEGFRLQLYYQPNWYCSGIFCTSKKHLFWETFFSGRSILC